MNVTTEITVNGTKKSERGFGLDDGDSRRFTIKPGEYDRNLNGIDDLVAQIEHSAYSRGEWISSFVVDGDDLVQRIVSASLLNNNWNVERTVQELLQFGMFCNAEEADLLPLVERSLDGGEQ